MRSTIHSVVKKAMLCASKSDHVTLTKGLRQTQSDETTIPHLLPISGDQFDELNE
jgi:hypothetical protein